MTSLIELQTYLIQQDPILEKLFNDVGLLDFNNFYRNPYVALIGAIIGRRIQYNVARAIRGKLFSRIGTDFTFWDVHNLTDQELAEIGCPVQLIRAVNSFIALNSLDLNNKADIYRLKEICGIGDWTIRNILVTSFLDWDIFISNDKFIQARLKRLYNLDHLPTVKEEETIASKWAPYRTVVSWYLWRYF